MKIILSRKGFDSSSGGIASPIFQDGTFCSLPIPAEESPCFEDISFGKTNMGDIIERLTQDKKVPPIH